MPTRLNTNFPPLTDSNEFESLIRDICAKEWGDPNTKRFGRSGQEQFGVDIYGQPVDLEGKYRAAQCKLRTKRSQLTRKEIETEVRSAEKFPHQLDMLIIVTDAPRDTKTQVLIDNIRESQVDGGKHRVEIWFWDDVKERLALHRDLIIKFYPDYYSSLSVLPDVERLVDIPVQVAFFSNSHTGQSLSLEEALKFRGIRTISDSEANLNNSIAIDGVVFYFNSDDLEKSMTYDSMLRLVSKTISTMEKVRTKLPFFLVLPPDIIGEYHKAAEVLSGNIQDITIMTFDMPSSLLVDQIFKTVYEHGYMKRGGIPVVDIIIRTREGKPKNVVLDVNWSEKLSITRFPTEGEWEQDFLPALRAIRCNVLDQSDTVRLHFDCQLPLPAAFAVGFYFNVRVADIGVWARKMGVSVFKQQFWLSGGTASNVVFKPNWIKLPSIGGKTAIVELTTYVSIHNSVQHFSEAKNINADAWVQFPLIVNGEFLENIDEANAVAYASQVGQLIRSLNARGITDIHLFARIPSSLAIIIGQRLLACGRIHLYWFKNPNYEFGFTLQ